MIITIDGASGTGKSSIAEKLAHILGIAYFDTGAMYRSFAWYCLKNRIPYEQEAQLERACKHFCFKITKKSHYLVCGIDVTNEIRTEEISLLSSKLSALSMVRKKLQKIQKEFAKTASCVVEGRDMGSVVFAKEATVKFFLTASLSIRAKRRYKQLVNRSPKQTFSLQELEKNMASRDKADRTRKESPLRQTSDMIALDTTDCSLEQIVLQILQNIPVKKMRFFPRITFCFFRFFFRYTYGLQVQGKTNRFAGAGIVICNTTSLMDPFFALMAMEQGVHIFLDKIPNRLFRILLSVLQIDPIFLNQKDSFGYQKALEVLQRGEKILLFPTTAVNEQKPIFPSEPKMVLLALQSNCPILPIYLTTKNSKKRRFLRMSKQVACHVGKPFFLQAGASYEKRQAREKILSCEEALEQCQQVLATLEMSAKNSR